MSESVSAGYVERSPLPPLRILTETKANPLHPDRNEDAIFKDENSGAVIMLDGMGGLKNGDRASQAAGAFILEHLKGIPEDTPYQQAGKLMHQTLVEASNYVQKQVPEGGTTATCVKLIRAGKGFEAVIGHVGDSRAYVIRRHGRERLLQIITEDDMAVYQGLLPERRKKLQEKFDRITDKELQGGLLNMVRRRAFLSKQEANLFIKRNQLTQFLGAMPDPSALRPHIYYRSLDPSRGDALLLSSDGLDNLALGEVETIVNSFGIDLLAQKLVEAAYAKSLQFKYKKSGQLTRSRYDDISVAVARAA